MPTVVASCLDLARPTKGQELAAFTCSLSAGRTLPLLAGRAGDTYAIHNNNRDVSAPGASELLGERAMVEVSVLVSMKDIEAACSALRGF